MAAYDMSEMRSCGVRRVTRPLYEIRQGGLVPILGHGRNHIMEIDRLNCKFRHRLVNMVLSFRYVG